MRVDITKQFVPNLFILGAAKCGTTTLHGFLRSLPNVCMSRPKEPFFFEAEYENGLEFYRNKYFAHWSGEDIIGESRHRNLIQPYVPERIHAINSEAKLVVIVRDPIERCYSHWFHLKSTGDEELSFDEAIREDYQRISKGLNCSTLEEMNIHSSMLEKRHENGEVGLGLYRTYLDSGYYMEQVNRYLKFFKPDQLKVIIFEEMTSTPAAVFSELMNFLGLETAVNLSGELWLNKKKKNSLWKKKYPWLTKYSKFFPIFLRKFIKSHFVYKERMKPKTRRWLIDHYRQHNAALEQFLQREIPCWQHHLPKKG